MNAAAAAAEEWYRSAPPPSIRLMIVDDSPVARAVLSRMLAAYKDFEVLALASSAEEAVEALRDLKIDIVILDLEMPGTSGLQALPALLEQGRGARVLVVSSLCEDGAEAVVQALTLGAADTLPKPGTSNLPGRFSEVLAERLRRIGPVAVQQAAAPAPTAPAPAPVERRLGCVAVGASTGGLHAIVEFLRSLPIEVDAPLLVTQHLPTVFMPFFARQIEAAAGRTVRVAEEGMTLRPGEILLAPGDAHLTLNRVGSRISVKLDREPSPSGCMPSVDTMLASVAAVYGPAAIGVVLSGMGRDGFVGGKCLVERGGTLLAQDRDTSAVWGMPRVIAEAGLAEAVLAPAELARRIGARVQDGSWK